MKKRMIALLLAFAMLISVAPAVIADDTVPRPTVEEILSEYHQKAFEAEVVQQTGRASANSRSAGGSGKTLEQETVATLNAAGYEAYNVTSDNYKTLEKQLQTDFSEMGLDSDASYIITISGEENSAGNNARGPSLDVVVDLALDGGPTYFEYTYGGTTYKMRYVTVTAGENSPLGRSTNVDVRQKYGADNLINALNLPITIASSLGLLPYTGTVYSLFSAIVPNINSVQASTLQYTGGTNWTITYTQIYDSEEKNWVLCASVEYVTLGYVVQCSYYNPASNRYEFATSDNATYDMIYSSLYDDKNTMKEYAALAYENYARWCDKVQYVEYKFAGETVILHTRWQEYLGYEP